MPGGNVRQVYSRRLSPCQPNQNNFKRLRKQSIGALLLLFTFSLISWLIWLTKERNAPNIRLFPVNRLSTKASTKPPTSGFSVWKFHLPGFFFRDFPENCPSGGAWLTRSQPFESSPPNRRRSCRPVCLPA